MTRCSKKLLPKVMIACLFVFFAAPFAVGAQSGAWNIERSVSESGGDAEEFLEASRDDPERWPAGFSYSRSSDLELAFDATHGPQVVGLRFSDLEIPRGARVTEAVVSFTADSDQAGPLELVLMAQADPNPAAFRQDSGEEGTFDLSSRATLGATVNWSPEPWETGSEYRSPDIAPVLQQVVNDERWQSGGAVVLLISPVGQATEALRSAFAFDAEPDAAPRLLVRFEQPAAADGNVEAEEPAEAQEATAQDEENAALDQETAAQDEGAPAEDQETVADAQEAVAEDEPDEPMAGAEAEQAEAEAGAEVETPAGNAGVEVTPVVPEAPVGDETIRRAAGEEPPHAQAVEPGEEAAQAVVAPTVDAEAASPPSPRGVPAEPRRARYPIEASEPRGLSGSVLLSDYGSVGTVVAVFLDNPAAQATYRVSLQEGDCGSVGGVVALLEPVEGSRGFSTSTASTSFDELTAGRFHLNLFRITDEFTRRVACVHFGS